MDAAVHLVLRNSNPNGVVIATRDNWTGRAVALPISDLLAKKEPLASAGVYVLVGVLDDGTEMPVVYIGEAEEIADRVTAAHKQFQNKQVTWQRAVVFVSNGGDLNKAHIKWLEASLVALAHQANRVSLANGTTPAPPKLSEPDEVFVKSFLANMLVLYPFLRVNAFDVPTVAASASPHVGGEAVADGSGIPVLFHKGKGKTRELIASGRTTAAGGVVLLAGSKVARKSSDHIGAAVVTHRKHLADTGSLTELDDTWWKLNRNYEISSPSTAVTVVNGSALNGLLVWKDAEGTTLGDLLRPPNADKAAQSE